MDGWAAARKGLKLVFPRKDAVACLHRVVARRLVWGEIGWRAETLPKIHLVEIWRQCAITT
jgi:hypothetical protein